MVVKASRPRFAWLAAFFHSALFSSGTVHGSDTRVTRRTFELEARTDTGEVIDAFTLTR